MINKNTVKARLSLVMVFMFVFSLVLPAVPAEPVAVAEEGNGNNNGTQTLGDLEIGDRVVDNSWEWEHKTGNNYTGSGETKPITWIVVGKNHYSGGDAGSVSGDADHVTLLSEELIGKHAFDNSTNRGHIYYGSNHWGDSGTPNAEHGLRPFLNSPDKDEDYAYAGDGFYNAIPDSFSGAILETTLSNATQYDTEGNWDDENPWTAYEIADKVFILSQTELGGGSDSTTEIGSVLPYFDPDHPMGPDDTAELNIRRRASLAGSNILFWTRSPFVNSAYSVRLVGPGGGFGGSEGGANHSGSGVRPALNLSPEIPVSVITTFDGAYEMNGASLLDFRFNDYENDALIQTVKAEIREGKYGNFINVQVPEGTDVSGLKASFINSLGATVKFDGEVQESGVTVNNFSSFLTYTVISDYGGEREYKVRVLGYDGTMPVDILQVGDRVVDNSWKWSETKPITWIVVGKNHYSGGDAGSVSGDADHVTLLSEELIGKHAFDNSTNRGDDRGSNHWGDSGTPNAEHGLRPFLNSFDDVEQYSYTGDGFYDAIPVSFKDAILETTLPNATKYDEEDNWASDNPWLAYETDDKVFILSQTELGGGSGSTTAIGSVLPYFDYDHHRGPDTESELNIRRRASLAGSNLRFWTRSPHDYAYSVRYVSTGGGFYYSYSARGSSYGVRPALNLSSEILVSVIPNFDGAYEMNGASLLDFRFNDYENDALDQTVEAEIHEGKYGNFINLLVPEGTDVSSLKASFINSPGATVQLDGEVQESGVTAYDFSTSLTYTVISDYGEEKEYKVRVLGCDGTMPVDTLQVGDRVVDTSWEWEYKTGANYSGSGETKPVTWIVAAKDHYDLDEPHVTLVSEELIGYHAYDDSTNRRTENGDNRWDRSGTPDAEHGLRPFLNSLDKDNYAYTGDGFIASFSKSLQDITLATGVSGATDKVFVLSQAELGGGSRGTSTVGSVLPYFNTSTPYGPEDEEDLLARRISAMEGEADLYWTRSPASAANDLVRRVSATGNTGNAQTADYGEYGVRPAFNISADAMVLTETIENDVYAIAWNTDADILTYRFLDDKNQTLDKDIEGNIDSVSKTITATVPHGTDLLALVADFELSPGAKTKVGDIHQVSGETVNDFTNPIVLEVTAENGITKIDWTITVIVAEPVAETAKPVITTSDHTVNTMVVNIEGTAEPGAFIRVAGGAAEATGLAGEEGSFNIEVTLTENEINYLSVTAQVEGKAKSETAIVTITHKTGCNLNIKSTEGGSTEPAGNLIINYGDTITVEATPETGYEFVSWSATAGNIGDKNAASTTFTMPIEDATLTAHFIISDPFPHKHVILESQSWVFNVIDGDLYIGPDAVIMVDGNVTVHGNVYVFGALRSYGNLQINGTIYGRYFSTNESTLYRGTVNFIGGFSTSPGSNNYVHSVVSTNNYINHIPFEIYNQEELMNVEDIVEVKGGTLPIVDLYANGEKVELNEKGVISVTVDTSIYNEIVFKMVDGFGNELIKRYGLREYDIQINTDNSGGGSVSGEGTYLYGDEVTVSAFAKSGFRFVSWTENGEVVSTDSNYCFTVDCDRNLIANFDLKEYSLTLSANPLYGGSVTGGGAYKPGTEVSIEAIPEIGYEFVNWSVGEDVISEDMVHVFIMPADDTTLNANFEKVTYTVIFEDHDGTVLKEETVAHGESATTPDDPEREGYTFTGWDTAFDSVTEDLTVTATYQINEYTLIYTAGENGSIEGETSQKITHGSDGSPVTAIPEEGYYFTGWSDGLETASRTDTNVTEDIAVTANFAFDPDDPHKEAEDVVNSLFDDDGNLLYDVTQEDINNATALVMDIKVGEAQDVLLRKLVEAQEQLDARPESIKYGDVTGDGNVAVGDAIAVLRHIVGLQPLDQEQKLRAKVSKEGENITVQDAILILRYIVGLIQKFPVEET